MRTAGLLLVMALAPHLPAQSPSEKTDSKKVETLPESDEHVYARKAYTEVLQRQFNDLHDPANWRDQAAYKAYAWDKLIAAMNALKGPWTADSAPAAQALMSALGFNGAASSTGIRVKKLRLDHVDDCLRTYKDTVDKKMSDLTTRESDIIKGCRDLDMYPPLKAE